MHFWVGYNLVFYIKRRRIVFSNRFIDSRFDMSSGGEKFLQAFFSSSRFELLCKDFRLSLSFCETRHRCQGFRIEGTPFSPFFVG